MNETRAYTVMVVDDNDDVRRLVKKVLESAGHNVIEAVDGASALKMAENVVPDLIFMDIRLPGAINGLETVSQMREDPRLRRVPVVALSASVTEKDQHQAISVGCSGFVCKPIDISTLPGLVEKFIARGAPAR